jgi:hypothetical protein
MPQALGHGARSGAQPIPSSPPLSFCYMAKTPEFLGQSLAELGVFSGLVQMLVRNAPRLLRLSPWV